MDCDFIPLSYHHRRRIRKMLRRRIVGVVALVCLMILWGVTNGQRLSRVEAMMADAETQHKEILHVAQSKLTILQELDQLATMQKALGALSGDRSLVYVLSDLSRRMPDSIVLTKCDVEVPSLRRYAVEVDPREADKGVPPNQKNQFVAEKPLPGEADEAKMVLFGIGVSVADIIDFVDRLEKSSLFYQVNYDVLDEVIYDGRTGRGFRLECRLARHREVPA